MITLVSNLKGGSGKSTITFNLAVWLTRAGKKTIAYDFDPQRTLSDVVNVREIEGFEPELTVYRQYRQVSNPKEYEFLVDVGASNMPALRRALKFADRVIVPVPPSQADIWATQRFLLLIASIIKEGKPPEILAFINRADTHSSVRESDEAEEVLRTLPGIKVLNSRIYQRTVYRRSFSEGLGVFELEPSAKAACEFEKFATSLYPLL
jgi:chromosome partitioning protein